MDFQIFTLWKKIAWIHSIWQSQVSFSDGQFAVLTCNWLLKYWQHFLIALCVWKAGFVWLQDVFDRKIEEMTKFDMIIKIEWRMTSLFIFRKNQFYSWIFYWKFHKTIIFTPKTSKMAILSTPKLPIDWFPNNTCISNQLVNAANNTIKKTQH